MIERMSFGKTGIYFSHTYSTLYGFFLDQTVLTAAREPAEEPIGRHTERRCSVAASLNIVSDAWSFLIIREAFFGARRFETFRTVLNMTRATLTDRLARLTREEIFRQIAPVPGKPRMEYRLTKKGFDLYPSFMAMIRFGDEWLSGADGPPLQLIHSACRSDSRPFVACSCCGAEILAKDVSYRDGRGAGQIRVTSTKRVRRSIDTALFLNGRPSSVSRTLQIIGDRWSFLILREAFFGSRRFEKLQVNLGIATNILSDRLSRLVDKGIFDRVKYQLLPERFEYRLTRMGRDLYPIFIILMSWGDRWINDERPLILTHKSCGQDFIPTVICAACRRPVDASEMRYKLRYRPEAYGAMAVNERVVAAESHSTD
jgi:DNA-binding HxlR family transcriptional regulator